ncbi:hypothetical protein HJD18_13025 [Thermoleophilia bacterium SCSIO 60948]|nr:hypothetical protein HJD18_13025 [Thermoleophilia bacterium SCSIO 60948]
MSDHTHAPPGAAGGGLVSRIKIAGLGLLAAVAAVSAAGAVSGAPPGDAGPGGGATLLAANCDETVRDCAYVDRRDPVTSIVDAPGKLTNESQPKLKLAADEPVKGFRCRVDSGRWENCDANVTLRGLSDGEVDFEAVAIDKAGNQDASPATASFVRDTKASATEVDAAPRGHTRDADAVIEFSSRDASAKFECNVDNGGYERCSSPLELGDLDEGVHQVSIRAHDKAGNVESSPAKVTFVVDREPPQTRVNKAPKKVRSGDWAKFGFGSNEAVSYECRLDGGAFRQCDDDHRVRNLKPGSHELQVRAIDRAGNADASPASVKFKVTRKRGRH